METPANKKVHTVDSEDRSTGLEESTSNSKAEALPEKLPGNKAVASSQHAGHSSSSEKSAEQQGAPQKTRKKPSRGPSPWSSPESAISSKPPGSLKRKASSDEVPQETPGNTQDKIPVGPDGSGHPASGSVQNKQHRNVTVNRVGDLEKFFEEWAKHKEYAMCFTAAQRPTKPERNTKSSMGSAAQSSEKQSTKPARSTERSTLTAFFEGGYRITGIAVFWEEAETPWGEAEAHYLCWDTIDPKKLSEQLAWKRNVIVPDVHRAFTCLARPCNLNPANCGWTEPKLASWLLDPDNKNTEIPDLIQRWTPHLIPFLEEVKGFCSPPQDVTKKGPKKASKKDAGTGKKEKAEGFCSPPQDVTKKGPKKASEKDAGTGKKEKAEANVDAWLNDMESSEGAGRLAVLLWDLHKALVKKLEENHMNDVYEDHMVPALGVHSKVLLNGIGFLPEDTLTAVSRAMTMLKEALQYGYDTDYYLIKFEGVDALVQKKVASLTVKELKEWKMQGNDSLKELSRMLTDAGQPDFASKILDWRKLNLIHSMLGKLKDKFWKLESHQTDGTILHMICPLGASWKVTGRAECKKPNLQYINNNIEVSTEPRQTIKARAAFRPSSGAVLLSADYSQLEMRVLACLSKDEKLCEIFREGGDVFRTMAALWNDKDKEDINDTLRNQTKKTCYGILYGMGSSTLAEKLRVAESEAEKMKTGFQTSFPGVDTYRRSLVEKAKRTGEVRTLMGRRRLLPELHSNDKTERDKATRQVLNTVVQGSAADIFWEALRAIDMTLGRDLGQKLLRSELQQEGSTYMVLQMHDEVLLDVWKGDFDKVVRIVRKCMEVAARKCMEVAPSKLEEPFPFPVRMRMGASWGDMEEI